MAQFSNTAEKNGLIQKFERYARLPDGEVTGTLLKQVTDMINEAFDDIMPLLLSYSDHIRWDDTNHTDAPIGYLDLVSGQADYKIGEDDNSLDILNITKVRILPTATDTDYYELERMTIDDPAVAEAMSPGSQSTGIPSFFVENAGKIFLYPEPNYSATSGIEIFFGREQSYFTSTDTTKEPGIPKPFHNLLALYAAHEYVYTNRPEDGVTIANLQKKITDKKRDLQDFIDLRNPTRLRIKPKGIKFR